MLVSVEQLICGFPLKFVVSLVMRLSPIRKKVDTEMEKARRDIEAKLLPSGPSVTRHLVLPASGRSPEWILGEMDKMDEEAVSEIRWRDGRVSGAVYHGGEDLEVRPYGYAWLIIPLSIHSVSLSLL